MPLMQMWWYLWRTSFWLWKSPHSRGSMWCRRENALCLEAIGFRNIRSVLNLLQKHPPPIKSGVTFFWGMWVWCPSFGKNRQILHSKKKSKCFARNILLTIKVSYFLSVMQSMCLKWESPLEDGFQILEKTSLRFIAHDFLSLWEIKNVFWRKAIVSKSVHWTVPICDAILLIIRRLTSSQNWAEGFGLKLREQVYMKELFSAPWLLQCHKVEKHLENQSFFLHLLFFCVFKGSM